MKTLTYERLYLILLMIYSFLISLLLVSTSDKYEIDKKELQQQYEQLEEENYELQAKVDSLNQLNKQYISYIMVLTSNREENKYKQALSSLFLSMPIDIWEEYVLTLPEIEQLYFNSVK